MICWHLLDLLSKSSNCLICCKGRSKTRRPPKNRGKPKKPSWFFKNRKNQKTEERIQKGEEFR